MANTISLTHSSSALFKSTFADFKKSTQDCLNHLLTDVNSIVCNSTELLMHYQGQSSLQTPIPHNFYDHKALEESIRGNGDSYAIFPELEGKNDGIFGIKTAFAERGVLDHYLQDRVINLILQCRGAIHYGIAEPIQQLTTISSFSPNGQAVKLSADVLSPDQVKLKIEMPMRIMNEDLEEVQVGILNCELNITTSSIYLNELSYTKTNNTDIAKEIFDSISANHSLLEEIWNKIKELLGLAEQKPEFELSLKSPSP